MKEIMYKGSLVGDPEAVEIVEIAEGDVTDLSSQDAADILFRGAPVGAKTALKRAKGTPAEKVARVVAAVSGSMNEVKIPHIILSNGDIVSTPVRAKIPGALLRNELEYCQLRWPGASVLKSVSGSNSVARQTITFSTPETVIAGVPHVGAPVLFGALITKQDSGRSGAEVTIWLEFSNAVEEGHFPELYPTRKTTIRRNNGAEPLDVIIHPFWEVGDSIIPRKAVFGPNLIDPETGDAQDLLVHIEGLMEGETFQVSTPGYDSVKYQNYLKRFKVNIL